jgi:hypothetical protein
MQHSNFHRVQALGLATGLVGWSFVGPRLPARVPLQAGLAGLLVLVTRAPLGLRPPPLWTGLRLGLAVGSAAATAVAASTSVPAVRVSMAERELPAPASTWLGLRIPLGTVWAEEAAFRAALTTVAGRGYGVSGRYITAELSPHCVSPVVWDCGCANQHPKTCCRTSPCDRRWDRSRTIADTTGSARSVRRSRVHVSGATG